MKTLWILLGVCGIAAALEINAPPASVTLASQPFASVYAPDMEHAIPTATYDDVYWSLVSTNTANGISFNVTTSSNIFTVSAAGTYLAICQLYSGDPTTAFQGKIQVNGVSELFNDTDPISGANTSISMVKILKLNANDNVRCQVQDVNGGTLTATKQASFFQLAKIQ